MVGQATFQLAVLITLYFVYPPDAPDADYSVQSTCLFNTFVFLQLFNQINARKVYHEWNVFGGLVSNKLFMGIWVLEVAIKVVFVEFGGRFCRTQSLSAELWLMSVGLGALSLPVQVGIVSLARAMTPQASKPWKQDGGDLSRLSSKLLGGLHVPVFRRNQTRELRDSEVFRH